MNQFAIDLAVVIYVIAGGVMAYREKGSAGRKVIAGVLKPGVRLAAVFIIPVKFIASCLRRWS